MKKRKSKAQGPLHEELVEHLLRSMEQQGLTIESADAPGYRKPGQIKAGLRRGRVRPDVVARDGRRAIFGVAMSEAEASKANAQDQLETLAGNCRTLVVCLPAEAAKQAVDTLFQNTDMPHWRKMRLLKHPDARWQEVPRRQQPTTRPAFGVRVVVERNLI